MGNTISSISSPEKENSQRFEFTSEHSTSFKKELLSLPNISRRRHSASSCRTITFPTHPPFPSSSHSTFSTQILRQSEEPSKNSHSQSLSYRLQENIQFQYRNGRKYYNVPNSKYCLPLDDEEIDRLQLQHFLFRYIWQGNFSAPVEEMLESGCKVLDVGCGPGTWILDMATTYQRSQFFGVDMVPTYPLEIKPFNTTFVQSNILFETNDHNSSDDNKPFDVEFNLRRPSLGKKERKSSGLPFQANTFDFVHLQNAAFNFTEEQWQNKVIPELVRVTKVGGWIELCEVDPKIVNLPTKFSKLYEAYLKFGRLIGVNLEIAPCLGEMLKSYCAGQLADFHHKIQTLVHYDHGSSRVGVITRENFIQFYRRTVGPMILETINNCSMPQLSSFKGKEKEDASLVEITSDDGAVIQSTTMTQKEYNEMLDSADEDWKKNECYNDMHRFYARKFVSNG